MLMEQWADRLACTGCKWLQSACMNGGTKHSIFILSMTYVPLLTPAAAAVCVQVQELCGGHGY
jgi:hypothetical protein